MNALLVIKWSSVAMTASVLVALGMFIFIASFFVAELQKRKFTVQYETLKDFIDKAPVDQKNYDAIRDMFNETYCYSDDDCKLISNLAKGFRAKFREYVPELPAKG